MTTLEWILAFLLLLALIILIPCIIMILKFGDAVESIMPKFKQKRGNKYRKEQPKKDKYMKQYIDKDALVAEIENLENTYKKCPTRNSYEEGLKYGRQIGYKDALYKINTLEVKEVDLEKEIDNFYGMYRKNGITFSIEDNQECLDWKVDCNPNFEKAFAKHFFELGIKVKDK